MVVGDIHEVNLSTSSFEKIITENRLYVDKSKFIENFLNTPSDAQIIARQRRLGKSMNMSMLRCFLTDQKDNRRLFDRLYIRNSPVWPQANSSPVFYFDFKDLGPTLFKSQIQDAIKLQIKPYLEASCNDYKELYESWLKRGPEDATGLKVMTQIAFNATGKKSYILIDEYDSLMMKTTVKKIYNIIRSYLTDFLSSGFKGNDFLEKGLMTGVMRITHEGMLSGLNNLDTFDVFSDKVYSSDYGLTEDEAKEVCDLTGLSLDIARQWYNGIKIGGVDIYNTYSVLCAVSKKEISNYWGMSGTLDRVKSLITPYEKSELLMLLDKGAILETKINQRIGPQMLKKDCDESALYSLLVQSGYLSLDSWHGEKSYGAVSIPNLELASVWREFIFNDVLKSKRINSFFKHLNELDALASDVEKFLDCMFLKFASFDLPATEYKRPDNTSYKKIPELYYHHIVFTALIFLETTLGYKSILSNRESGDGRYDVWIDMNKVMVVFEFKSGAKGEKAETLAKRASKQVKDNRYGAEMGRPVIAVGCGFALDGSIKVSCLRIEY
ncbi:MAG: ATP-binding protein [Clostridiales bacterium]|jgi:hypothetical protein|nr:ATP-binding protein [Clostridiales bacterium]